MADSRRDYTIDDIKAGLLSDLDNVLRQLGIDLAQKGGGKTVGYYKISCPFPGVVDKHPSFLIYRTGVAKGAWKFFSSGETGSIFHLIERMGQARDQKEAVIWAKNYLGWTTLEAAGLSQEEMAARRADRERQEQREQAKAVKKLKANRGKALHRWAGLARSIEGTHAQTYLFHRGIDIQLLDRIPSAIRFDPAHPYCWPFNAEDPHPAIVSQITGPDGTFFGVHRIFLNPDGTDKIAGMAARKSWPEYKAGMIRISRGEAAISPEKANRLVLAGDQRYARPLVITEGIEDGLAVALAKPDLRIWAAVSLSNYHNIPDMPCISEFILCRDNDWDKPQAVESFNRAAMRLKGFGKPVRIAPPPIGKDANDVLLAGADHDT